jgi:hypothetical protein
VTVPKIIAEQYAIRPGNDIEWIPAGDAVRVRKATPRSQRRVADGIARRLELFDLATQRQKARQAKAKRKPPRARDRGWRREDLYDRGRAR